MNSRALSLSVMAAFVACANTVGFADVILDSSSGPVSTVGKTINFTTEGTLGWVHYAGSPRTQTPFDGNERSGMNMFSALSLTGPTTTTVLSGSGGYGAQGATVIFTNGTNPVDVGSGNSSNTYNRGGGVGDGLTFEYAMPANSTQTLKLYAENFNALGILSLTSSTSGLLYADSQPVGLPSSDGVVVDGVMTPGSGHGAGVYSFTLTNASNVTDLLTFTYVRGAVVDTTNSIGIQGVTVSAVPEPASVGILAVAASGLLMRRRVNQAV